MAIPLETIQDALGDKYQIDTEIGRGAMATVFRGRDTQDRDIALKVLRPEFAVTIIGDRFHREIAILTRLGHPNILPLYESGEAKRLVYFTMPFASGGTLRDRIHDSEGPITLEQAARIVTEIAGGLDHAHAAGVIHRDIKPENVVFDSDSAVICDFGIARAVMSAGGDRISTSGLVVGTPAYMSPEQASGLPEIDHRADLYGLACVVYEIFVGEPPFTGRSTQAIMTKQVKEPPPSLRVVRPDLPQQVEAAINTALAKAPADRFGTAAEFAAALMRS
jgi:serine/threonine-protein kinase